MGEKSVMGLFIGVVLIILILAVMSVLIACLQILQPPTEQDDEEQARYLKEYMERDDEEDGSR